MLLVSFSKRLAKCPISTTHTLSGKSPSPLFSSLSWKKKFKKPVKLKGEIFYYEIGSLIRFLVDLKYSKNLDYKDVQLALKAGLLVIYEKLFFWYGLGA